MSLTRTSWNVGAGSVSRAETRNGAPHPDHLEQQHPHLSMDHLDFPHEVGKRWFEPMPEYRQH